MSVAVFVGCLGFSIWLALAAIVMWCRDTGFRGRDVWAGLTIRCFQVYARLMHRPSVDGLEHVPERTPEGLGERPLIVIANHTAGVDPVLIQSVLAFEARWIMAADMRVPALDWLWEFGRVIFVDREKGDAMALREALRHLKQGLTLGVFPEGNIERPPRRILPFEEGAAMLAIRSGALVLPVIIEGTPQADPAWASLWKSSRSRLRFLPRIDAKALGLRPAALAEHLREVYLRETGWPKNDNPPRFVEGVWLYADEHGRYTPAIPK